MTEKTEVNSPEKNIAAVEAWIDKIGRESTVDTIEPSVLRAVLAELGANFEPQPELENLGKYSNKDKRIGLDAVWGKERVAAFKMWLKEEYIPAYENKTGRDLPTLVDPITGQIDTIKHSGMMQFLGELTAFAAGKINFENYQRLTEDRARKGYEWQVRVPNATRITTSHSSFPPGFPQDAWEKIKSLK